MTFVTHSGDVVAATPVQALEKAITQYGTEATVVWWIVPAGAITRSSDEDVESMFGPAHDKTYRMPGEYRTRTLMREATAREAGEAGSE
jgi:1,2-phenylacetyl-CoA epoxidase PaaB subunit